MRRFVNVLAFTAALLVGGTMISGTADAQTGGYYVAVPAAAPAKTTLITRSTPWTLRDGAFVAARAPERDAVLCELVVRNTGALSAFTVAGRAYDADALAKCNARARNGAGAAAGAAR